MASRVAAAMMPMSASWLQGAEMRSTGEWVIGHGTISILSTPEGRGYTQRGFTLLELLVVLALMGLAAAVAAPRVLTWAESAQQRALLGSVRTHLQEQPSAAFFAGRTQVLTPRPEGWDLPPGWQLYSPQPIVYEANGMTAGGLLELRTGEQVLARWRIEAPAGQVRE